MQTMAIFPIKSNPVKRQTIILMKITLLEYYHKFVMGCSIVITNKILHRDIKSQNIFLTTKEEAKIGDFGISKVLEHTRDNLNTLVGTPWYLSPEIIENKPYNLKSDIYALGVLLYEMWALKHPYSSKESIHELAMKIVSAKYEPIPEFYSDALK